MYIVKDILFGFPRVHNSQIDQSPLSSDASEFEFTLVRGGLRWYRHGKLKDKSD